MQAAAEWTAEDFLPDFPGAVAASGAAKRRLTRLQKIQAEAVKKHREPEPGDFVYYGDDAAYRFHKVVVISFDTQNVARNRQGEVSTGSFVLIIFDDGLLARVRSDTCHYADGINVAGQKRSAALGRSWRLLVASGLNWHSASTTQQYLTRFFETSTASFAQKSGLAAWTCLQRSQAQGQPPMTLQAFVAEVVQSCTKAAQDWPEPKKDSEGYPLGVITRHTRILPLTNSEGREQVY